MNIIKAIRDPRLFKPFLGIGPDMELNSWRQWMVALRALYGLPIKSPAGRKLVEKCTGRTVDTLPAAGFLVALFIIGRRCGKSRIAALIAVFEAIFGGHENRLAVGEKGLISISSPTLKQSRIVRDYIRGILELPEFKGELVKEDRTGFELRNGLRIEPLVADWRTVRGFTLVCAIVDEVCFLGMEADAKVKSDTELVKAIRPALATSGGKLICISSPYAKKGWAYTQWKKNFGNPKGRHLVWQTDSRTMNATLKQSIIDEAMEEDRAAALAEYHGQWRDDIADYLPRSAIESCVVTGRFALMWDAKHDYYAFADVSGGRRDDAAIAIAHKENSTVVIDHLERYRPGIEPAEACAMMAAVAKDYRVRRVVGDRYAADFVTGAFRRSGMVYDNTDKSKSELYLELLPRIGSKEIELIDDDAMVDQLANLERRTRSGGRDTVDHPTGGHDDLANVIAGVAAITSSNKLVAGGLRKR